MLNYRLDRKQNLSILKRKRKDTTKQPLRLKRALKSEEREKKTDHVLPINTNTTFNSTVSVLSCTATHMNNVLCAHTHLLTTRLHSSYKIFRRSREQHPKEKNLAIYIYIYRYIYLYISIYRYIYIHNYSLITYINL